MTVRRRVFPLLVLPLGLLVAACALLPPQLGGPTASSGSGGLPPGISLQRATWDARGIDTYEWQVQFGCFCPSTDPVNVTVVGGQVATVTDATGKPVADVVKAFPLTIDALYAQMAAVAANGGTVQAEFGAGGVPRSVSLDPIPQAVDDELGVQVLAFTAGP